MSRAVAEFDVSVPDPDLDRGEGGFSSGSLPEDERERDTVSTVSYCIWLQHTHIQAKDAYTVYASMCINREYTVCRA